MGTHHERRKIVVDGTHYGWVVHGDSGYMTLSVWRETEHGSSGQRLRVHFGYESETTAPGTPPQHRTITPRVVQEVIQRALLRGWDPFNSTGELRLTDV